MDYNKIKILLEKFFDGKATLEEENIIHDYFENDNVPAELENEKLLFDSFRELQTESIPDQNLQAELNDLIENKWKVSIKQKYDTIIKWTVVAAACLIIGLGLYFNNKPEEHAMKDTFADQKQAYDATKQVLLYISQTMNSGSSKLKNLSAINDNLATVNKLNKINETINNYKTEKK